MTAFNILLPIKQLCALSFECLGCLFSVDFDQDRWSLKVYVCTDNDVSIYTVRLR